MSDEKSGAADEFDITIEEWVGRGGDPKVIFRELLPVGLWVGYDGLWVGYDGIPLFCGRELTRREWVWERFREAGNRLAAAGASCAMGGTNERRAARGCRAEHGVFWHGDGIQHARDGMPALRKHSPGKHRDDGAGCSGRDGGLGVRQVPVLSSLLNCHPSGRNLRLALALGFSRRRDDGLAR